MRGRVISSVLVLLILAGGQGVNASFLPTGASGLTLTENISMAIEILLASFGIIFLSGTIIKWINEEGR